MRAALVLLASLGVALCVWYFLRTNGAGVAPSVPTFPIELPPSPVKTPEVEVVERVLVDAPNALAVAPVRSTLRIRCATEAGHAVSGAEVFLAMPGREHEPIGRTNVDGVLDLDIPPADGVEILARDKHAGTGQAWVAGGQAEALVTLHSGTISGRVARQDGQPLVEPVTVLIAPRRLSYENGLERLAARADVAIVQTDLDGSFSASVGSDEAGFLLYCGGGGWLHDEVVACEPGDDDVLVPLVMGYVGALEVACGSDDPQAVQALQVGCRITATLPAARQIDPESVGLALAGGPRFPDGGSAVRMAFAFTSPEAGRELGLRARVTAPGFSEREAFVECLDLTVGVSPTRVVLEPAGEAFGALIVRDRERTMLLAEESETPTTLFLKGEHRSITLGLPPLVGDSVTVQVPCGQYEARLKRRSGMVSYPPEGAVQVTVGEEPGIFEVVAAEPAGAVELSFLDPNGRPYFGSAQFLITAKAPQLFEGRPVMRGGGPIMFQEAPYVFDGLPPGTWYVKAMFPYFTEVHSVNVQSGGVSRITLVGEHPQPMDPEERRERLKRYLER